MNSKNNTPLSNIIWINNATSPSGALLAQKYSENGEKIILSAESRDELYTLKASCKGNPMNIHILVVDRSKPEQMLDRTKDALRIFGRIDTLVIGGYPPFNKPATETAQEEAKIVMDLNLWSAIALTKAVLPIMRRQESGHILIFTSLASKIGLPGQSAFSASQHALYGYFDSLRAEQTLPVHISLVLGELKPTDNSTAKFLKKAIKFPEEIVIDDQDNKLLRLKFLRPKAFFKRIKLG